MVIRATVETAEQVIVHPASGQLPPARNALPVLLPRAPGACIDSSPAHADDHGAVCLLLAGVWRGVNPQEASPGQ